MLLEMAEGKNIYEIERLKPRTKSCVIKDQIKILKWFSNVNVIFGVK